MQKGVRYSCPLEDVITGCNTPIRRCMGVSRIGYVSDTDTPSIRHRYVSEEYRKKNKKKMDTLSDTYRPAPPRPRAAAASLRRCHRIPAPPRPRSAAGSARAGAGSSLPERRPSSSSRERSRRRRRSRERERSRAPPDPPELEGEEREEPPPSLQGEEPRRRRIRRGLAPRGGRSRRGGAGAGAGGEARAGEGGAVAGEAAGVREEGSRRWRRRRERERAQRIWANLFGLLGGFLGWAFLVSSPFFFFSFLFSFCYH